MNKLLTRLLTGIIFVILIIGSLLINRFVFGSLFLVFTILGLYEFYKLTENESVKPQKIIGILAGCVVYIMISYFSVELKALPLIFVWYSIFIIIPIYELFRHKSSPIINISYTITGIVYIAIPFGILNQFYISFSKSIFPETLLMFFIIIWVYDTFAYLTGIIIGKHKLFERLSPKKTWEGLIGGMLFSIAASLIFSYYINDSKNYHSLFSITEWLGFALILILFATLGDLTESMLKRSINIKDSGSIFPGHGGILDRFDSVLLAAPAGLIYIIILEYFK